MLNAYKALETTGTDISSSSRLLGSSFHMNIQGTPQFWHYQVRKEPPLFESYCLACNSFVAASQSESNLTLVELMHVLRCKISKEDAEDTN